MKYLKKFENYSVNESNLKDNLYNIGASLTGKPTTSEQNMSKSIELTKKVVDILKDKGYELTDESGVMTDSSGIWVIKDEGMQPICLVSDYDRTSKIEIAYYFSKSGMRESIEIDENDLESTANKVASSIDKLRLVNNKGNIFSKQGNITVTSESLVEEESEVQEIRDICLELNDIGFTTDVSVIMANPASPLAHKEKNVIKVTIEDLRNGHRKLFDIQDIKENLERIQDFIIERGYEVGIYIEKKHRNRPIKTRIIFQGDSVFGEALGRILPMDNTLVSYCYMYLFQNKSKLI